MAPSFDHLREADLDDDDYDEDELDFSDLREKYEVQLDQGYDSFVVIDGLPEVTADQKGKLVKFLMKKLNQVGKTKEEQIYMPIGDDGKSQRCVRRHFRARRGLRLRTNTLLASRSSSMLRRAKPLPPFGNSTKCLSIRSIPCV